MLATCVLIADNNRLSYVGIDHLLRDDPMIRVVSYVTNWDQLMTQLDTIEHHVLLLSEGILPPEPFTALHAVQRQHNAVRMLILAEDCTHWDFTKLTDCGVLGVVLQSDDVSLLQTAIKTVAEKRFFFSRNALQALHMDAHNGEALLRMERLTQREREIFDIVVHGYDDHQVANALNLAVQTVRNHLSRIYAKLHVSSRGQLIAWAWKNEVVG